jgi:oxaloacetate decarboxylase beta subunit
MKQLHDLWLTTGFASLQWQMVAMWIVVAVLLYLAIVKGFEPLLLVPISLGALVANLPIQEIIMSAPVYHPDGALKTAGGLFWYLNQGIILQIYPPLIFLGVGALIDFGPLIANPRTLLLGGAAQLGIFATFLAAPLLGFNLQESASIGVIGGADGPTSIFTATKLAPHLLGAIAVAAYSYMALVPLIQPPIMKLLTTHKERLIKMKTLRKVSQLEKIVFALVVMVFCILVVPDAAPLLSMLFIGNVLRECKVTDRLLKAAQNEIINVVTIFLGICVGLKMGGFENGKHHFLNSETLGILLLGVVAFAVATAGGVLMAKLMNLCSSNKINPLIGSAGVSAVPMAARVSQDVGQKYDSTNYLLMHAMGPNVAGVIGSALAAGYFISTLK